MKLWRLWAKALGEKASKCDSESDTIAIMRTIIFGTYLITNLFIIAGVIRQWNRNEIPGCILQIEEQSSQSTKEPPISTPGVSSRIL
jgi:hypothetical protein